MPSHTRQADCVPLSPHLCVFSYLEIPDSTVVRPTSWLFPYIANHSDVVSTFSHFQNHFHLSWKMNNISADDTKFFKIQSSALIPSASSLQFCRWEVWGCPHALPLEVPVTSVLKFLQASEGAIKIYCPYVIQHSLLGKFTFYEWKHSSAMICIQRCL